MLQERFKLELRMTIVREQATVEGPPPKEHDWRRTSDRLEVTEELDLGALDFMEMTRVLGSIHAACRDIRNGEGPYAHGHR